MQKEIRDIEFFDPGLLKDKELILHLVQTINARPNKGLVPEYNFEMRIEDKSRTVGYMNLRIGNTLYLRMYSGHIGYGVEQEYRGNRYAARSCLLVLPIFKMHGINPVFATCNPENVASRRTLEIANAEYIEEVAVPEDHPAYKRGELRKVRYRFNL